MNPKRRLALMLLGLLLFVAGVGTLNRFVDPYRAWNSGLIDDIYVKGLDRTWMPYRLRTAQPSTLLVGSSRVMIGMPIEQGYRDGVLNAGLSGATIEEEAAAVELAINGGRLQRVVWGLDFFAFSEHFDAIHDEQTQRRLEGDRATLVAETLMSQQALTDTVALLGRVARGRARLPPTWVLPVPWPAEFIRAVMENEGADWDAQAYEQRVRRILSDWVSLYELQRESAQRFALFRDTVGRISRAGVELILFVPPLHEYELEMIRQTGQWEAFQRWKREVAAIRSYWDFSGDDELGSHDYLYVDAVHFKPVMGEVILRRLLGQDCGGCGDAAQRIVAAGAWVETTTVDEHLARQSVAPAARAPEASHYAAVVKEFVSRSPTRVASRQTETSRAD